MTQLFTDNALTTLAAGISAAATELTVAPGQGDNFPVVVGGSSDFFVITMEDTAGNIELIRCDVRALSSDTLGSGTYPLQRGFAGTTAQAWVLGDTVDLRWNSNAIQTVLRNSAAMIPAVTNTYDIGSDTVRWQDLFLSGNADIAGTLEADGITTLNNSLIVQGVSQFNSSVDVVGAVSLTLTTAGSSFVNQGTTTLNDTVNIVGANLITTGLIDGRDVATDGTKLDGIEALATADQTDAEIETGYNNQVAVIDQAEAEAGVSTTVRRFTAQRVAQAIAALASGVPGAANRAIQFNDNGQLGGNNNFQFTANGTVSIASPGAADEAIDITDSTASRTAPLLRMFFGGSGGSNGIDVDYRGSTGTGIFVSMAGTSTGAAIEGRGDDGPGLIARSGLGDGGAARFFDGTTNRAVPLVEIEDTSSTTGLPAMLRINHTGRGPAILLEGSVGGDGGGIQFGQTNSSSDSTTLDGYDERIVAMTLTSTGGTTALSASNDELTFTKIGRVVFVTGVLSVGTATTPSGGLTLSGQPFPTISSQGSGADDNTFPIYVLNAATIADGFTLVGILGPSDSIIEIRNVDNTTAGDRMQVGTSLAFNFSYITDD